MPVLDKVAGDWTPSQAAPGRGMCWLKEQSDTWHIHYLEMPLSLTAGGVETMVDVGLEPTTL